MTILPTMTTKIELAYVRLKHIHKHPTEYRINMWRYAMGLNDTVDIVMGLINKEEF